MDFEDFGHGLEPQDVEGWRPSWGWAAAAPRRWWFLLRPAQLHAERKAHMFITATLSPVAHSTSREPPSGRSHWSPAAAVGLAPILSHTPPPETVMTQ